MNFATAKREIKHWGLLRFAYDCAMCRLKPWLTLSAVTIRALKENPASPELASNRTVRIATSEELLAAASDPVYDLDPEFVRKAHARGEICVAVFEQNRIISYVWRAFGPSPHEKGLWVQCNERYPYSFKAYTHPEFRRQHLIHHADHELDRWLMQRGYTHCVRFVETHNYPSVISGIKRGHKRVGYVGYLTLFGRIIPFRSPGAKKHGFAFFLPRKSELDGNVHHPAK